MESEKEGLTRAELLRKGLISLTALTLAPVAGSCKTSRPTSDLTASPEEKLDVGYRETGSFSPGFHACRGLAVAGERLWVAGDMAVGTMEEGRWTVLVDLPGAAQAVAVSPDGALYATVDDQVVDLSGPRPKVWDALGPRARLVEIVATRDDVFVADAGNRHVVRYSRDGTLKNRIGARDPARGHTGLIVPSPYLGLALLPSGDMAVCNPGQHRVEVYSLDGRLNKAMGKSGQGISDFCGCCNPMALAVLPNGDLVTAEKGIPRVKVVSLDGKLRTVVAPPSAFNVNTTGLEVAVQDDRVLVLDPWEGKVRVFEPV